MTQTVWHGGVARAASRCVRVDEGQGKVFCLVEALSAEAAATVHREAHGLVADDVFEVKEGS